MKYFIVVACLLAVSSASHLGYAPWAHQAHHVPVLDAHGFQVDTPEVAHAKAAHFAAHADARARTGHVAHGVYSHAVAPISHAVAPIAHAPLAYAGQYAGHYAGHYGGVIPAFDAHGYQLDTPEVAAARAAHFAAYAKEVHSHHLHKRGIYSAPLAYGYHAQHIPTLDAHGFQLDTAEVAHAKAAHFAAHAEARARTGYGHGLITPLGYAHGIAPVSYAAPLAYAHHAAPLAIAHHGVPLDTPEVAAAKAAHFAAHAEVAARSHHY